MSTATAMPDIKTLFHDSWDTLRASFGNIFILSLLGSILGIIAAVVGFVSAAGIGFLSAVSHGGDQAQLLSSIEKYVTPETLGHIAIAVTIIIVLAILISTVIQLSIYVAIGKQAEKPSIGSCLSAGFAATIPVILMGMVTSLLVFGGWFIFIIPAILIGLFLQFVTYELALGGKKWFNALLGSVQIMSQHFGEVILRMLAYIGVLYICIYLPLSLIQMIVQSAAKNAPAETIGMTLVIGIIRFVVGIVAGFYGLVYSVKTYQHAKQATDESIKPKMTWIWVISLLGWVIAILIGSQIIKAIKSPYVQDKIKTAISQIKTGSDATTQSTSTQDEKVAAWKIAITPAALPYWNTSTGLFEQMKAQSSNPTIVKKLNDQNIAALQKAVALDDSNPELWGALSDANTWVSTKGSLQAALTAAQKAEVLDPTIWSYEYRTATTLIMLGRYDEAILKLQQVIRIEDNYGPAHIALGTAYAKSGIKDSARTEIQKGIDIFTKYNTNGDLDSQILDAQKALATLK